MKKINKFKKEKLVYNTAQIEIKEGIKDKLYKAFKKTCNNIKLEVISY